LLLVVPVLLLLVFAVPAAAWSFSGGSTQKDPVIFVHGWVLGYGLTPWDTMKDYLVQNGWSRDRLFEIYFTDPIWASNVTNAQELAAFVDWVLRVTGAKKVDLVCHSMGGLSARYYLKFLGGATKVDDYVAIGTPQHGTIMAPLGVIVTLGSAGCIEMTPGSEFLQKLNAGDETPGSVSYYSFGSKTDELVQPWTTIALSGATNKWVSCCEHIALVSNSTILGWVKAALS
jgi:triacylglycerol lipase